MDARPGAPTRDAAVEPTATAVPTTSPRAAPDAAPPPPPPAPGLFDGLEEGRPRGAHGQPARALRLTGLDQVFG